MRTRAHHTDTANIHPRPTAASHCNLSLTTLERRPDDVDELPLESELLPEDDPSSEELELLPVEPEPLPDDPLSDDPLPDPELLPDEPEPLPEDPELPM